MQRSVIALLMSVWTVASAQSTPVPPPCQVTELLSEFASACAADDGARCNAVLTRIAAAPDAVLALSALREQRMKVPLPSLVAWARLCADLMPVAPASERQQAGSLSEAIEMRAAAFAKTLGADQLPELGNQQAWLWNRSRVDANAELEVLVQQLDEAFEQTREAVCEVLTRRGPAALPAIDALQHLLLRELMPNGHLKLLTEFYPMRDEPRLAAARAMVAIAPRDERCVPAHSHLLGHGSADERLAAAAALGGFGGKAVDAVPRLLAATQAEARPLVRTAILALGQIGAKAGAPAIERLEALAAGTDKELAALATAALRQVRPAAGPGREP